MKRLLASVNDFTHISHISLLSLVKSLNEKENKHINTTQLNEFINIALKSFINREVFERQAKIYLEAFKSLPMNDKIEAILIETVIDRVDITLLCKLILQNIFQYVYGNDFTILVRNIALDQKYIRQYVIKHCSDIISAKLKSMMNASLEKSPYDFDCLKDETEYSDTDPIDFPTIRSYPILILDNHPFTGNKSENHMDILDRIRREDKDLFDYNEQGNNILEEFGVNNVSVGSAFNKIVLLEYITDGSEDTLNEGHVNSCNGDVNVICNALKNYDKVYLQNKSPFMSREYKRIARLLKKVK